ncbi:MAG TPA: hypothetical protein VN924_02325 [Bryobacteraceae bacterium]|jgi:hypothetical protein|nr:hypothetical protein [Bryobacteraceae bacterium]
MPRKKLPPDALAFFVKMGKRGGATGGHTRAANMTQEQRSESARNAVTARWARKKKLLSLPPQESGTISR